MSLARATLSKIHIAKSQLNMADDIYRGLLARVAGVRSAKELNVRQAAKVIEEFERLGWKPKPSAKSKGKPHNFKVLPAEIEKVEALLTDMGLSWAYADAIVWRMFKVQRVAWLKTPKQLADLIAALHVEQEKRALMSNVEQLLKLLGEHDPNWRTDLESLPKGWQRQRPILKSLVETLHAAAAARGLV